MPIKINYLEVPNYQISILLLFETQIVESLQTWKKSLSEQQFDYYTQFFDSFFFQLSSGVHKRISSLQSTKVSINSSRFTISAFQIEPGIFRNPFLNYQNVILQSISIRISHLKYDSKNSQKI